MYLCVYMIFIYTRQVDAMPIRHPSDWDQWSAKFSPAPGPPLPQVD